MLLLSLVLSLTSTLGGEDDSKTVVWSGRAAVLELPASSAEVRSSDPTVLSVVGDPVAGEDGVFVRVRGLEPGRAELEMGDTKIEVEVAALPGAARAWTLAPAFASPVDRAACTGEVAVGVEVARAGARGALEVRLELPDGSRLEPVRPLVDDGGPFLRRRFDVDTGALDEGDQTLVAVVLEDGREAAREERTIRVVRAAGAPLGGECEEARDVGDAEGFTGRPPRFGRSPDASGGEFVALPSGDQEWVERVTVEETGTYQLFVRARGDVAGGAYPSIGWSLDAPTPYRGTARLVHHGWQRIPVGPPYFVPAGEHHIGLRLVNDLNVGERSDRSLHVDAWELVPVPDDGAASGSMMMMDDGGGPTGPRGAGLWIGLERPLDGLEVNGRLRVRGAVNWSGAAEPAPTVELLVDGEPRSAQETARPLFALDRAHLGMGEHSVVLRASLPDGRTAETPPQTVVVRGPVAPVLPRDLVRIDVLDMGWSGGLAATLDGRGEEPRQRVARPRRVIEASIRLDASLSGSFRLAVEARAGGGARPARVEAAIDAGDQEGELRGTNVQGWWQFQSLGVVELAPGPKTLRLRLTPRNEDPELRVRCVVLTRARAESDTRAPSAEILYPASDHVAHGVDALVVRAHDDDQIAGVDVLIDGRPQGTHGHVPEGAGHLFVPLLLRDVMPGEHDVSVRVRDQSGNVGESVAVLLRVAEDAPQEPGPFARAVHLTTRLGLGPDPGELTELLSKGEERWLEDALAGPGPGDLAVQAFAATRAGDRIVYDPDRLVLTRALRTDDPVLMRHSLWIENHFSTWVGKTGGPSEWGQHRDIVRMGWAPFEEQLRASATSGVMLAYLDQDRSYAGRINENYARELMELHTVGVDGGYAQEDVTELARLLAGLTVSDEAPADGSGAYQRRHFRFDPELSDGRACELFGHPFERAAAGARFGRVERALELLARRPGTARHVARSLAEHYVSAPAPEALVDDLAEVYAASGGDFRALLRATVAHDAFWASAGTPRLSNPLDHGLRVGRCSDQPLVDYALRDFMRASGMGLFDRASPDGYPDDDASWADTNGLMQRWRFIERIPWAVRGLLPSAARRFAGGDPHGFRQRIVDHVAVRLTGRLLGDESNDAALAFFEEQEGPTWNQVEEVIQLVCRLPESTLK